MACKTCSGSPQLPILRQGFPTIVSLGPFPDHVPVPYTETVQPIISSVGLQTDGTL